jgi:glucosamine-phosphate N-acetyltransferase
VVEDTRSGRVVGTGTLFIERKIIHNFGCVGHVEDLVVDAAHRGQQLGSKLLGALVNAAKEKGCYKIILDCKEANVPFYQRHNFTPKERQMVQYFPKEKL